VPQSLIPLSVHPLSYPLYRSLILPAMHSHLSVRLLSCSAVGPLDRSTVGPFGPAIGPYRSAVVPFGWWTVRLLNRLVGTIGCWTVWLGPFGCGLLDVAPLVCRTVRLLGRSALLLDRWAVRLLDRSAVDRSVTSPTSFAITVHHVPNLV
jgi:hypothetical protein